MTTLSLNLINRALDPLWLKGFYIIANTSAIPEALDISARQFLDNYQSHQYYLYLLFWRG